MKNLGRKILFIIFIIPNIIHAGVIASVESSGVVAGELVTLNLTITGEDIQKPSLFKICDSEIVSTSSQTSIQMVNMDYKKSYVLSYKFMPKKSCTIEPISVEIDSKTEVTKPIEITVKEYVRDLNDDFILTFSTDKTKLKVGEPFDLTLSFKQKRDVQAVDSKFVAPDFKGFWMKGETEPTRVNEGAYTITKVVYKMAPQREGTLEIEPAQMKIASRANRKDSWGSWAPSVKWRTYLSNAIKLQVSPLPDNLSLVGDFTINAVVDKTEVNSNEALNLTIEVKGKGNLEDIKTFKPYVVGVNVFDEKIMIQGTTLKQKIAFVADSDFVIPSFELKYFDLETNAVKTVQTQEIKIKVNATEEKQELVVKKESSQESVDVQREPVTITTNELSYLNMSLIFLFGLVFGIGLMLLKPWTYFKKEKTVSIKDPKVLLVKLMPYKDDEKVKSIIDIIENNLYSNAKIELDKKLVKECLSKYEIS